jgi:archaemetzincin
MLRVMRTRCLQLIWPLCVFVIGCSTPRDSRAGEGNVPAAKARAQPSVASSPSPSDALAGLAPELRRAFEAQPGFAALHAPEEGEWRDRFAEPAQSVTQFRHGERVVPSAERRTIFILPLGAFPEQGSPPLPLLADYAHRFFGLAVQLLPAQPVAALKVGSMPVRRRTRSTGVEQLLSGDLLDALRERVPAAGYGLVGVTMTDLFPAPSWNYVFGEARFAERVGVYSFARYDPVFFGEPRTRRTPHLILTRSLKVMTHELGHMFGIAHCQAYRCLMNGSNSLDETDAAPMHLCPQCLHKLHVATAFVPARRYRALEAFYASHGFESELEWTRERLRHLSADTQAR